MSPPARSLDPVAAGWGGLIAAIGPIAATGQGWPATLGIVGAAFGLGGFLAGVRSVHGRVLHALAGALLGVALHLLFIALTWFVGAFGGPDVADVAPGSGAGSWLRMSLWGAAWAVVGGLAASGLIGAGPRRR